MLSTITPQVFRLIQSFEYDEIASKPSLHSFSHNYL